MSDGTVPDARPVVIVNPRSAGGLSERRWAQIASSLADGMGPFDHRFTESSGDGRRLAREEATAGRKLIVALGGDGTISEVADGILAAGGQAEMGIVPRGTGGDFRRTLELPEDLRAAGARVRQASARRIDVGLVTFKTPEGNMTTRHFINVASFGLTSNVAARANQSSKRWGAKLSFLGATLQTLLSYDNVEVFFSADGAEPQRKTVLAGVVGNGRYFGGGMKICPEALLDDGRLDLVVIGDLNRFAVVTKFSRIYGGTHITMPEVQTSRICVLAVTPVNASDAIPLEIDGETPGFLPATFEVRPKALSLRF